MTMVAPPHALLADASLRRSLAAVLRQRVPAGEAEDLAQTVLCDALASPRLPTDPTELRRWVVAIARHKIADYHRRARRLVPTADGALDPVDERAEPVEARELLEDVVLTAEREARGARTLAWLVREHEGERFSEIAADEGLPADVVRQRVSRLRRALRARYAGMLALLLASGGALAGMRAARTEHAAIVAEASTDEGRALGILQGTWRVETLALDPASEAQLETSERVVLGRAASFDVVVAGTSVRVGPEISPRILRVVSARDGLVGLALRAESGAVAKATLSWEGEHVHVAFDDGRLRGTARLVRK